MALSMDDVAAELAELTIAPSFAALHDAIHGVILSSLGLRERCAVAAQTCKAWRAHARALQLHHSNRALESHGALPRAEGELLSNLLDYGRFTVCDLGFERLPGIDSPDAVSGLRAAGRMAELAHLNAHVYTHWRDVYASMRDSGVRGYGAAAIPTDYRRIGPQRVTGVFWVLGEAPGGDGTIVFEAGDLDVRLSHLNRTGLEDDYHKDMSSSLTPRTTARCFLVVGIAEGLAEMIERAQGKGTLPILANITLIPWRDVVAYDGIITSAGSPLRGVSHTRKRRELIAQYIRRADQRAVIERLPPLPADADERTWGSHRGDPRSSCPSELSERDAAEIARELAPIARLPAIPGDNGAWVLRRFGYTEAENPNHLAMWISGGGSLVSDGPVVFSALVPTAHEVALAVARACVARGGRPHLMQCDDPRACAALCPLLDAVGVQCHYYPPPSAEEASSLSQDVERRRLSTNAVAKGAASLVSGTRVKVRGLTGAKELNGRCGVIRSFDEAKERFSVHFDDSGGGGRSSALVKRVNLMVLGVRVARARTDAPSKGGTELNSPDTGLDFNAYIVETIVDEDGACTYVVEVAPEGEQLPSPRCGAGARGERPKEEGRGTIERWPAETTLLPMSTAVCLAGVKSELWRSKWGVICDRDDKAGRYVVEVGPPKKRITVRFGALHL